MILLEIPTGLHVIVLIDSDFNLYCTLSRTNTSRDILDHNLVLLLTVLVVYL
jgi:hypothetical protein